jgi:undecaprenyl diphosphate synthase
MSWLDKIDLDTVPTHVAIIMDGNGRWAQSKGQDRVFGHFNGVEAVRASLKGAMSSGVKYLTLYAFSTENWNRPTEEVEALMDLLVQTIMNEIEELDKNGVRLWAIGDLDNLPNRCKEELEVGMKKTASNDKVNLILALSYSAKWEIVNAVKKIAESGIPSNEIDADLISQNLVTANFPDPELMIRTSGEHRISNFLLWQLAYAELYFTETYWPDFNQEEFYKAICDYQGRERRFGKTSEQIIA